MHAHLRNGKDLSLKNSNKPSLLPKRKGSAAPETYQLSTSSATLLLSLPKGPMNQPTPAPINQPLIPKDNSANSTLKDPILDFLEQQFPQSQLMMDMDNLFGQYLTLAQGTTQAPSLDASPETSMTIESSQLTPVPTPAKQEATLSLPVPNHQGNLPNNSSPSPRENPRGPDCDQGGVFLSGPLSSGGDG
ncbi:hypothetical protein PCANC_22267 [Puccinia coronata f. sp. avenae]|uniref:Uncharacterized protein n=1 Tax=Puccinia coronata f. sp. avenae TaxID=200324 RepID=A0A2N5UTK8_9BASI|nr:hypothetical protein PCANC_22267 [Puccinia coronata f. sp. avenae]